MTKRYDSKFEKKVDETFPDLEFHPSDRISYTVPHKYEPDFKIIKDKTYFIESKGRFRTSTEASKYKYVRESLDSTQEIIFLFMKPNTPMPNAKKRKDGTKQTQEEWATKNNFRYFYIENFNTEEL